MSARTLAEVSVSAWVESRPGRCESCGRVAGLHRVSLRGKRNPDLEPVYEVCHECAIHAIELEAAPPPPRGHRVTV